MSEPKIFRGGEAVHAGVCTCCQGDKFRILDWDEYNDEGASETTCFMEIECQDCYMQRSELVDEGGFDDIEYACKHADMIMKRNIEEIIDWSESEEKLEMETYVKKFSQALQAGHILPEDF